MLYVKRFVFQNQECHKGGGILHGQQHQKRMVQKILGIKGCADNWKKPEPNLSLRLLDITKVHMSFRAESITFWRAV